MWRKPRKSSNLAAFTLLEIMVVLVILAIAAVIVLPNISGTDDLKATSAARMITADLQYAQNIAITHQEPVTVSFNTGGESYTLSNASGPLIHPMTKSAYTISFGALDGFGGLNVVSASFFGTSTVTFDELGAPDNSGSVVVQAGPHVYQIDVAVATGKVSVTHSGS